MEAALLKAIEELRNIALLAVKDTLTINEVSMLTGLKPSYIRKLAEEGKLSYSRPFGKQLYFDKTEIVTILKSNRVDSVNALISQSINNQ